MRARSGWLGRIGCHGNRSVRLACVIAWSLGLCVVGCGAPNRLAPRAGPSVLLRRPSAYDVTFSIDQEVTAEHANGSETFRAVVEKEGDRLVMVALGPHGGRAFVLTQQGEDVRFESHLPRELPFSPEWMLLDIHRTWMRGVPRNARSPLPDGDHEALVEGERVVEHWSGGRLLRRTFRGVGEEPGARSTTVAYEGGLGVASLPERVVIESSPAPGQRYRLVLARIRGHFGPTHADEDDRGSAEP